MANEAVVTDLLGNGGDPVSYQILDGTTCAKGAVMEILDNRYVQTMTAANTAIAGILTHEKVAGDGQTQTSVYTNCVAKFTAGGAAIAHGDEVVASAGANILAKYDTLDHEKGYVIGYSLETAGDTETFHVRVKK